MALSVITVGGKGGRGDELPELLSNTALSLRSAMFQCENRSQDC
jgi:hypothetical protein